MPINEKAITRMLKKHTHHVITPEAAREMIKDYQFYESLPEGLFKKYENLRQIMIRHANIQPDFPYGCSSVLVTCKRTSYNDWMKTRFAEELAELLDTAIELLKE